MKKRIILIILAGLFTFPVFSQYPPQDKNWQLQWQDTFSFFNNSIWRNSLEPNGSWPGGPPEICVFTGRPENCFIDNGKLVLQALREEYWYNGKKYNYTSAEIHARSNYNVRYGYIESRIKLPFRQGLGFGFWTFLGEELSNYQNAAEIDIFEIFGFLPSNTITTNIHTCYRDDNLYPDPQDDPCKEDYKQEIVIPGFNWGDWHTYAVEWNTDRLIWYVDGKAVRITPNPNVVDSVKIIIGLGATAWSPPDSTAPFPPAQMLIDYINVYQLKCDGETVIEIPDYNTFNYGIKKSISLSGVSSLKAGEDVYLRATDFIELKAGFEVPAGAELYLNIDPCDAAKIILKPNKPNPFCDSTLITCYVSAEVQTAELYISDLFGTVVKTVTVTDRNSVNVTIKASDLPSAGTYNYLLVGDGEASETMQLIFGAESGEITIEQNYPNPFNDFTTIECYIPQTVQNAQLQVYDKCGMLVKTVVVSKRCATEIQIHASELPAKGIYTYVLTCDGQPSEAKYLFLE